MRKYKTGDIVAPVTFKDGRLFLIRIVGGNDEDYFISPYEFREGTTHAMKISHNGLHRNYTKLTEEELKFVRMLML